MKMLRQGCQGFKVGEREEQNNFKYVGATSFAL